MVRLRRLGDFGFFKKICTIYAMLSLSWITFSNVLIMYTKFKWYNLWGSDEHEQTRRLTELFWEST